MDVALIEPARKDCSGASGHSCCQGRQVLLLLSTKMQFRVFHCCGRLLRTGLSRLLWLLTVAAAFRPGPGGPLVLPLAVVLWRAGRREALVGLVGAGLIGDFPVGDRVGDGTRLQLGAGPARVAGSGGRRGIHGQS